MSSWWLENWLYDRLGCKNQMREEEREYRTDLLHQGIKTVEGEGEERKRRQGSGGDGEGGSWDRKKPMVAFSFGSNSTQEGRETTNPRL